MTFKKLTLALVATLAAISAMAQEGEKLRLSLQEAQDYAVAHNYALQNATLNVKKAEATRWQTLSSMLPQVKAGFDYQNMCGYEMNFGGRSSMGSMMPDSITIGGQTFPISFPSSGGGGETASTSIPMNPSGTFSITASIALTGAQIVGTLLNDIAIEMANISHSQSELTTRTNVKSSWSRPYVCSTPACKTCFSCYPPPRQAYVPVPQSKSMPTSLRCRWPRCAATSIPHSAP